MKFQYAKNEHKCQGCKTQIIRNEECFAERWTQPDGIHVAILFCHANLTCYHLWKDRLFEKLYSKWKTAPSYDGTLRDGRRPELHKRGRKQVYQSPEISKEINRLKALQRYHSGKGNKDKVNELEFIIKEKGITAIKQLIKPIRTFTFRGQIVTVPEKWQEKSDSEIYTLMMDDTNSTALDATS